MVSSAGLALTESDILWYFPRSLLLIGFLGTTSDLLLLFSMRDRKPVGWIQYTEDAQRDVLLHTYGPWLLPKPSCKPHLSQETQWINITSHVSVTRVR